MSWAPLSTLASPFRGQLGGSLPTVEQPSSVAGDNRSRNLSPFLSSTHFPSFLSHSTTPPVWVAHIAAFFPGSGPEPISFLASAALWVAFSSRPHVRTRKP